MEDKMCAVVKDLLTLYYEDTLCDVSRQFIDDHLSSCDSCSQFKVSLESSKEIQSQMGEQEDEKASLKKVATRLKRRRVKLILGTATGFLFLIILFTQVLQFSKISGSSMMPTFSDMQDVVINRWAYLLTSPKRGDIIAFYHNDDSFVKRIIGLPGDTIDNKNGLLIINGNQLKEEYNDSYINIKGDVKYPITLGDNEYFVLGDNRDYSLDSRYQDFTITKVDIWGKVLFKTKNIFGPKTEFGSYEKN